MELDKKKLDWTVTATEDDYAGGDIHCVPNNDLRPHIQETYCECKPRVTEETPWGRVLVHNAFDEREIIEKLW